MLTLLLGALLSAPAQATTLGLEALPEAPEKARPSLRKREAKKRIVAGEYPNALVPLGYAEGRKNRKDLYYDDLGRVWREDEVLLALRRTASCPVSMAEYDRLQAKKRRATTCAIGSTACIGPFNLLFLLRRNAAVRDADARLEDCLAAFNEDRRAIALSQMAHHKED